MCELQLVLWISIEVGIMRIEHDHRQLPVREWETRITQHCKLALMGINTAQHLAADFISKGYYLECRLKTGRSLNPAFIHRHLLRACGQQLTQVW